MPDLSKYNWSELLEKSKDALLNNKIKPSWRSLAIYLRVPRATLQEGFAREFGVGGDITALVAETPQNAVTSVEEIETSGDDKDLVAEVKSSRILTLEQLIDVCKIDTTVWEVDHWVANKWEVGAKDNAGNVVVSPLFQIKAWLKRKSPVEINFVTLSVSPTPIESRAPRNKEYHKALIIPDTHFGFSQDLHTRKLIPYHDRKALHIALQIAAIAQPDRIIYLGDMLDFAEFSLRFPRTPENHWMTQPALREAAWWFAQFGLAAPDADEDYIEGNHEERLLRALSELLPTAYKLQSASGDDLLSVPKMLGLESLGIKYHGGYPDTELWLNSNLRCIHGSVTRNKPGATALAMIEGAVFTTIFGHVHKTELVSQTIRYAKETRSIYGFCPGTLAKIDGTVPGSDRRNQWQQGIGLVYYNDEYHNILSVSIQNGKAIFAGNEIIGDDLEEQITAEALTTW